MLTELIHLLKLLPTWAPVLQVLGVVFTFCWMAFLGYGIMFLIGWFV